MSYQEETHHPTDIPPELLTLARHIARSCRTPGTYTLTFTVSPHKARIATAQITKQETIRTLTLPTKHP